MFIRAFLAGVFLFNSIPHLVKGITGETHMTPFMRRSSPILNILWAFVNILLGLILLGPKIVDKWNTFTALEVLFFLLGGLIMSILDANLFGNPNAKLPWHKD